MDKEYNQILVLVAESPGTTLKEITDMAADHGVIDTDIPDVLSEALRNDDLLEFDDRYWVMRKGKYGFHQYDHPET
ncbi:hypothetical protein HYG81_24585 (plasmid) [Natrinema zhouii]|uniref:hypothetical protein n=1 Tax=Natrinema zhouii TaxID=1710539 RepID=UPI001CFF9A53|nr:hypothetical protein [Natrinema zhouii]UHQ98939.1 hypothetical protein HYG81_24585 [Natrinema zhouii]